MSMTVPVLPDTDVLVDYFRGQPAAVELIQSCSSRIILSAIVVAELYAGVRGNTERSTLDAFISLFRIVPVDAEIAWTGGLLKRDYARSHGVGLADAIVAATVVTSNAELKTLNTKHYPMLAGLKPAYRKP
jgi:hypothetical protein